MSYQCHPVGDTLSRVQKHSLRTRITAQNTFFNLRKIDNPNKWKNYVIVTRVKLSVKLDALVVR